jgi:hypothetical protein
VKKFLAVVVIAGALFWAKKHFMDKPSAESPAAEEKPTPGNPTSVDTKTLTSVLSSVVHRDSNEPPEVRARARMDAFMSTWKEGGTSLNDAEQAAACLWSRGKRFITDRDEIQDAANGFDRFRRDKDLYTRIQDYQIQDAVERGHDEGRGDFTIFTVKINGVVHKIGVPDKPNPLFWLS